MPKYFKIVPKTNIAAITSCETNEDAIETFATYMSSDINKYFEPIEISKEEYDRLKNEEEEM